MLPIDSSTQRLVQFLAALSGSVDARSATRIAAERAAGALEAEVAAVILGDAVYAVGFPRHRVPEEHLRALADRTARTIHVPGVGECPALVVPLHDDGPGVLLVARQGDGFSAEESNLLRGMAQMLHLVLVMLHTLEAERGLRARADAHAAENADLLASLQGRHALLEALIGIQRAISRQAPLAQVLESIVSGAHELLGGDIADLCLVREDVSEEHLLVSAANLPASTDGLAWRGGSEPAAVSTEAIRAGAVVVTSRPEAAAQGDLPLLRSAIAAPVHEGGRPVGALIIGSLYEQRSYSSAEISTLATFAEHVSLAVTEARTLEDMRQAHHDGLTGLATRRLFMEQVSRALERSAADGSSLAVLFLDLDRFKMVNDTLGHGAGDTLLVEVARRLLQTLRSTDLAARFGGDEFAVLLEGISDVRQAREVAERVREAMRLPVTIDGRQVFVDVSAGVAATSPGQSLDAESLLRDADVAMYESKRGGAGRISVFEPRMLARFSEQVALDADLRTALARDQFVVHYQPIVDLATGAVAGVEALVRWQHPERGMVPPLAFIPVAEETGLILPIGEFVLRAACAEAASWTGDGCTPAPYVSVNISGRQLQEASLPTLVASALADAGLPASALVLEITESVLLEQRSVQRLLHELKTLGVRLAVDDFGSGYSSLSYLRSFPVDILKIDKSFVDGIATSAKAADLAAAIAELGTALSLQTVAEGVETAGQLEALRQTSCAYAQGYLFSRPLTAESLSLLLSAGHDVGAPPALSRAVSA